MYFECPTCTLKKKAFVRKHTEECQIAQKKRQEFEAARAAQRQQKAAAHKKPKAVFSSHEISKISDLSITSPSHRNIKYNK